MFRKLRQKIENVEGNTPSPCKDSDTPSSGRRIDEVGRKGSRALLHKSDSLNSLNGSESDVPNETSNKEDLFSALINRTAQVKRLEVKLAEYGQSLKERKRECEKLTNALEKQQDNALCKLNELNETYTKDKTCSQARISHLEEREKENLVKVDDLEEENKKLKVYVKEWEEKKDEFDKQRQEFYEKRDSSEELLDLQRQELAKLKHMLMNSERECKNLQLQLDENIANLLQTQEQNGSIEADLRELTSTNESARYELNETLKQRDELEERYKESETLNRKLTSDNLGLKDKLSTLALDIQKTRSMLSSVETARSSLEDEYRCLKHNSEAAFNKVQNEAEENQSLICHLEEKLKMMEQRSNTEKLPIDERMNALIDERFSLEQKLEESRQQLVNIKSTWSDQINQLETQVAHLNQKISEDSEEIKQKNLELDEIKETMNDKDSEEIKQKNLELDEIKETMNDKVDALDSELTSLNQNNSSLSSHNVSLMQQIAELEAKIIEQQAVHDLSLNKSKQRESDLDKLGRDSENKLRKEIDELSLRLQEGDDVINALKIKKEEFEEKMEEETDALNCRIESLLNEVQKQNVEICNRDRINGEMGLSLEELRCDRDEVRQVKEQLLQEIDVIRKRFLKLEEEDKRKSEELDAVNEDLSKLQLQLKDCEVNLNVARESLKENHEGCERFKDASEQNEEKLKTAVDKVVQLEEMLEKRTTELMACKEEVASLKNNQVEEGEEVKLLKLEQLRLEDEIVEKDRLLKLHQLRINDIKKALQKELNKNKHSENSRSTDSEQLSGKLSRSTISNDVTNPVKGDTGLSRHNGTESDPIPSLLSGDMSLDDPSLSDGQRDVVVKYLKHVVLRFLSGGQSEAQQLIKAISAILHFSQEEEKLVRDVVEYRSSWFASRPNTKSVLKPSLKGKGRHHRR